MSTESNAQQKREQRLKLLEDDIGRALAESARNGELSSAPSYGKPLHFGDVRQGIERLSQVGQRCQRRHDPPRAGGDQPRTPKSLGKEAGGTSAATRTSY